MKIGVFGGSFDPIHNGHIRIAALAKYKYNLQKILFVPLNQPWLKKVKTHASPRQRIEMCEIAIKKYKSFEVSDVDIVRGGISYMIDTINDLKNKADKQDKFFVIIGDDNIENIKKWKKYNELCKLIDFIVAPREENIKKGNFKYIEADKIEVSSSEIRKSIQFKKDWSNLVPRTVKEYIVKNNLYQ